MRTLTRARTHLVTIARALSMVSNRPYVLAQHSPFLTAYFIKGRIRLFRCISMRASICDGSIIERLNNEQKQDAALFIAIKYGVTIFAAKQHQSTRLIRFETWLACVVCDRSHRIRFVYLSSKVQSGDFSQVQRCYDQSRTNRSWCPVSPDKATNRLAEERGGDIAGQNDAQNETEEVGPPMG